MRKEQARYKALMTEGISVDGAGMMNSILRHGALSVAVVQHAVWHRFRHGYIRYAERAIGYATGRMSRGERCETNRATLSGHCPELAGLYDPFNMFNEKMYGKQYAQDAVKGRDRDQEQSEFVKTQLGAIKDAERMKTDRLAFLVRRIWTATSPLTRNWRRWKAPGKEEKAPPRRASGGS